MKCRICESQNLKTIFVNRHCPVHCHSFDRKPSRKLRKLTVLQCGRCSLVQLADDYPPGKYEDDYQRNITHSESARKHAVEMSRRLLSWSPSNFLEVGCGSGMFASLIKPAAHVTAFEPSRPAAIQAAAKGINVRNEFFDSSVPNDIKNFDSFAVRFVLEHVPSPVRLLREICKRCEPGAIGLIEVPNSRLHIRYGRWTEFFPEHLSYFTHETLAAAAAFAGFSVLEAFETMNSEFLGMTVQRPLTSGLVPKPNTALKITGLKTYAWGASGASITKLASMPISGIKYLIDTDPNKQGLFCPGSGIKIADPGIILREPPEAVLITAPSYTEEIVKQLKEMGYTGKIGTLLPLERWL